VKNQRKESIVTTSDLPRIAYRQQEAAQVLGVSDRTLRDWMDGDNPPPSFRRGKVLLFPHDGLIEWLRLQTCETIFPQV
jgi:hypothetical protein